ncbi:MAG: cation:proton antiporter domain-containing protein [Planctomycetota bacterium]|jgi:Kef-type K+ transport system membrane component KefB/mannitol/fructose-specific phosphotransferase system IIA component (Ntr-type)
MPLSREGRMLGDANIILTFAVVLVAGALSGQLAKRFHLPSVTGQILAGILLVQLNIFTSADAHRLEALIDFALGLMAVAVGSHLHFGRLRVARRRLIAQVTLEATITPLLVFSLVMLIPNTSWQVAALLATIAVATAPATILALVKETRAKGVFVKTLVASVALNNLACICLFEVAHAATAASFDPETSGILPILAAPLREVLLSFLLGGGIGSLLVIATRRVVRPDRLTAFSLIAILLTVGAGQQFGVSALLSCLFLGMALANLTPDKEEIGHQVFDNFDYAIFAVFFTVAGMELDFKHVLPAGVVATLVFAARMLGKVTASAWAMKIGGATERVRRWLGVALVPQAGLAIGLMLLVTEDQVFDQELRDFFLAVVLTVVLLNEIVGPILTRHALKQSGDYGKDRARVIDFLHEENISTRLEGPSKEEAIEQLVDLCIRSNRMQVDRKTLLDAVKAREAEGSTCLGEGLSIPHARLDVTDEIVGAMGISSPGFRFATPDGLPVHCMVLLVTPTKERDRHLEVLSALARAIGADRTIQQQLYHAHTPAHAYELLHADEESEEFNYYLDDEDEE